jgi:hypothetical protein
MPEVINCPSCQRKLQVPEALIGQDVQCPTCGATFTASAASAGPAAPPPPVLIETPPQEQPSPAADWDERRPRDVRRDSGYPDDDYEEDYGRRPARRRRSYAPHRGNGILTMGILSIVFFFIPLIGLTLGIIAWIMGNQDIAEIHAGRMDPEGESSVSGGRVCGIIGTCIGGLMLLCSCLYLVAVFAFVGQIGGRRF